MSIINENACKDSELNNHSDDFILRIATENDRDDILNFIRKHYYPEEPITMGNEPKVKNQSFLSPNSRSA